MTYKHPLMEPQRKGAELTIVLRCTVQKRLALLVPPLYIILEGGGGIAALKTVLPYKYVPNSSTNEMLMHLYLPKQSQHSTDIRLYVVFHLTF